MSLSKCELCKYRFRGNHTLITIKGKVVLVHAKKTSTGSLSLVPPILNRFTPGKGPRHQLNKICGLQSQSGRFEGEKNLYPTAQMKICQYLYIFCPIWI